MMKSGFVLPRIRNWKQCGMPAKGRPCSYELMLADAAQESLRVLVRAHDTENADPALLAHQCLQFAGIVKVLFLFIFKLINQQINK